MTVLVRLLGPFEILCDDVVAIDGGWRPAKAAALVKILALQRGRNMHRDQLIDLLWPEADAEAGSSSFYKNLHHLRAALRAAGVPDLIALNRGAVSLSPDVEIDVEKFRERGRRALGSKDVASMEQALAGCGGELLPADLYETWTEPHRDEFCTLRLSLRRELGERYLQRGRIDSAVSQYQQILAADPVSEEAHRGLMRAYGTSGQRDLALRQYERCKELLRSELGVVPSDETEELHRELRRVPRLRSPIEEAIEAPASDGDAALRRCAFAEAVDHYRDAIDRLHAAGEDDEREAGLWLKLATARSAVTGTIEVVDDFRRAADLADRAGAFDLLASALVQFQDATDGVPANHAGHRESAELILAALERCPPGDNASRALLLAASARPLSAAARRENEQHITGRFSIAGEQNAEIETRLREAVAIARRVARRDVLASTIARLRVYITSPDTLAERLELTRELVELNANTPLSVSAWQTCLLRHEDLIESGDLDGARIQARTGWRIGEAMQVDGIIAAAGSMLATHAMADGALEDGKRLLLESNALEAQRGPNANAPYRFGVQLLALRWHQGRTAELYDFYRRAVDGFPALAAIRALLALICAESARLDEARAELDIVTADGVDRIPKDYLWWLTCICMSHVAIATGARRAAADLYSLMLAYVDRNASTAGAVSFGSAALVVGQLAAFLGQDAQAEEHYQAALAFNIRTRQRVWIARTRYHYADLLFTRGAETDVPRARELARVALADAREIGMDGLLSKLSASPFAALRSPATHGSSK